MAQCVVCSTEVRDDARFCPACGAEQPRRSDTTSADDPFIGQTVNRNFKIEKLLGVGGMGKVYKARQLSLDKYVVIKILHDQFRDDPQLVQRFQREARAASRLNHPNSIQVIDFGQDENKVLFMAQEFLEGVDLFTVLRNQGPLPRERVARIMMQVCSALAEAHENNVIHRDLKPENIMVEDRRGQRDFVKVLDFGIAKIQDPDDKGQALTQAGMVCGTPEYMSPEQARGMQLDSRSDLYSLGVLVYQLITGELPFTADSPIGIVTKHIIEEPQPPRARSPHLNIDPTLEAITLKAMAKDLDTRYQTAAEMGEDFERLLYAGGAPSQPGVPAASGTGSMPGAGASQPSQPAAPSPTGAGQASPIASSSSTSVQPATTTSPTPSGISGGEQRPPSVVTYDDLEVPKRSGGGGGMKWAALAVVGLLVVGGGVAVALMGGGEEQTGPDAKVATSDGAEGDAPDTTKPAVVSDAVVSDGKAQKSDEAVPDDTAPDPVETTATEADDAVVAVAHKSPKTTRTSQEPSQKLPKVSQAKVAKAKELMKEHMPNVLSQDAAKRKLAYEGLRQSFDMNPRDPAPLLPIAMYHRTNGHMDKSCAAIRRFISLKKKTLSKDQAASYLKQNCAASDLPSDLQ